MQTTAEHAGKVQLSVMLSIWCPWPRAALLHPTLDREAKLQTVSVIS